MYPVERSILQKLDSDFLKRRNVQLYVKRDDLIDFEVSGNKWRKLKYNVQQAVHLKSSGILTFGGAYSNHLVATAAACAKFGLRSIGIVRGEELTADSNNTLKRCQALGMHLKFVTRNDYQLRNDQLYWRDLSREFQNFYFVPEGGANYYGMMGCQEIVSEINILYDALFVAQGTATTSCGLLLALPEKAKLHVVPVLKGFDSLVEMKELLNNSIFDKELTIELMDKVVLHPDYHFGGYGKYTSDLLSFIRSFFKDYSVPLDPIYTGKLMLGVFEEIRKGQLDNQTIVCLHTGGLQGVKGLEKKENFSFFDR
jgi:1-aminocyclopropane-1-carboxylate deaminase